MKAFELIESVFDINKSKEALVIKKSVENLNRIASRNPDLPIGDDIANINTSFAAMLAQIQAQNLAAEQEVARKNNEDKIKATAQAKQSAGIGSTIPVKPAPSGNAPTTPQNT